MKLTPAPSLDTGDIAAIQAEVSSALIMVQTIERYYPAANHLSARAIDALEKALALSGAPTEESQPECSTCARKGVLCWVHDTGTTFSDEPEAAPTFEPTMELSITPDEIPVDPCRVPALRQFHAVCRSVGLDTKSPEMYPALSGLCGREIKSRRDLQREELNRAIGRIDAGLLTWGGAV